MAPPRCGLWIVWGVVFSRSARTHGARAGPQLVRASGETPLTRLENLLSGRRRVEVTYTRTRHGARDAPMRIAGAAKIIMAVCCSAWRQAQAWSQWLARSVQGRTVAQHHMETGRLPQCVSSEFAWWAAGKWRTCMCMQQPALVRGQLRSPVIIGAGPALGGLGHASATRTATRDALRGRLAGASRSLH